MKLKILVESWFIVFFITVFANMLSAQSLYDNDDFDKGLFEDDKTSYQIGLIELNLFSNLETNGAKGRFVFHGGEDFGFGWEGLLIFADVSGETCTYWINNFFVDVLFLEIWLDGYLGGSIGYAFGEELADTKSFSNITASVFLAGPIIRGADNFPVLCFDLYVLSHKLSKTWDNYHFFAELIVFPFAGGLRPFGISIGCIYGEMLNKPFWGLSIGVSFGTYTITH